MSSHKTECESYAYTVAEERLREQHGYAANAEATALSEELLSAGDVSCICSELPS